MTPDKIIVTLGGTAISLGIGALQIGRGFEMVAGIGEVGNAFLIGTMPVPAALAVAAALTLVEGAAGGGVDNVLLPVAGAGLLTLVGS